MFRLHKPTDRPVGRLREEPVTTRAGDRELKRHRLIEAAASVFARQGYTATRMAEARP